MNSYEAPPIVQNKRSKEFYQNTDVPKSSELLLAKPEEPVHGPRACHGLWFLLCRSLQTRSS